MKKTNYNKLRNQKQETDSLLSPSRQLRKLMIDITKEFSVNRGKSSKEQES